LAGEDRITQVRRDGEVADLCTPRIIHVGHNRATWPYWESGVHGQTTGAATDGTLA
jgi:hypothetical protein